MGQVPLVIPDRVESLLPEGVEWNIAFDGAEYVENSIANVQFDIAYGAILAILVVFYRNRGSIAVEDVNMMKG